MTEGHENGRHEFSLVTLNAFGVPSGRTSMRLRTIARELNNPALDAVCLQEVQMQRYVPLIFDAFTHFEHASWEPHIHAPKGGLMSLTRRPQRRARFVPFRKRGWFLGPTIADRLLYKGMLISDVLLDGDQRLTLINTHLAANYSGRWDRSNRYARLEAAQLSQLAEEVNRVPSDTIVVVAGDFNIPRFSWLYHEFLDGTGLHDPLGDDDAPTYRPSPFLPGTLASLDVAIDHALVRVPSGLDARVSARIILRDKVELIGGGHSHLSDHYGIHLEVAWGT